jgi:hypothetical protein
VIMADTITDAVDSAGAAAVAPGGTPVFVDDSGRRRRRARRLGRLLGLLCLGYLALVGTSVARAPWLSRILLPGVAELLPLPAPQAADPVLANGPASAPTLASPGSQATTKGAKPPATTRRPGGTTAPPPATTASAQPISSGNGPAPAFPAPSSTPGMTPTTTETTATTAQGTSKPKSTSTSTSSSTPTTLTTTPPSQPGQGSSTASPRGLDGQGPPGQLRKSTTTTTTPPGR